MPGVCFLESVPDSTAEPLLSSIYPHYLYFSSDLLPKMQFILAILTFGSLAMAAPVDSRGFGCPQCPPDYRISVPEQQSSDAAGVSVVRFAHLR